MFHIGPPYPLLVPRLKMLIVYWLICVSYYSGNCFKIPIPQSPSNEKQIKCVTNIVKEHYAETKVLTYLGNKVEDESLLKAINIANTVSILILSRQTRPVLFIQHEVYLISSPNASYIAQKFPKITKQASWNPLAQFLVIVKDLKTSDLRNVFDTFLKLHARNVVVMSGTEEAHLYSYNPFDNYGCGKRYDNIISYGECSQAWMYDLYPKKMVTKLRNCTFDVIITQWPPYTILAPNDSDSSQPLRYGAEPHLFQLIGRMQDFQINIIKDYNAVEEYPTVSTDMEAVGSLKKIQDNEADAALGGMLLTPSRALAFSFVYGHLAYTDEIRFIVKLAPEVPAWKNLYLEFESTVWALIILSLIFYSLLVIILLRTEDKSHVVLILVGNLVLHGRSIRGRLPVKCVIMCWIWFAYLINTFYQSGLFSLTTNPAKEYQISNEEDIVKFKLQPCFSSAMEKYYLESVTSDAGYKRMHDCDGLIDSVTTVANSKDLYTIFMNGQYLYNKQKFLDEYGKSRVVTLAKPYSKVIFSIFLYKGFPMINYLHHKALRLRELGLADKIMNEANHLKQLKYRFHGKEKKFQTRFAIPWHIYIFGCTLALVAFIIELNMPK